MTVDSRPETEEDDVPPIYKIHVEIIGGVYILLQLEKEDSVDIN